MVFSWDDFLSSVSWIPINPCISLDPSVSSPAAEDSMTSYSNVSHSVYELLTTIQRQGVHVICCPLCHLTATAEPA